MRVAIAMALVVSLTPGCLRTEFDLCAEDPPDPNCAFLDAQDASGDAGVDAPADAGVDAPLDAGLDAGADAGLDAGAADASTAD